MPKTADIVGYFIENNCYKLILSSILSLDAPPWVWRHVNMYKYSKVRAVHVMSLASLFLRNCGKQTKQTQAYWFEASAVYIYGTSKLE